MARVLQGNFAGEGKKIAIVASRFNEFITTKLLGGAMDTLQRHGVNESDITIAWVPGAFEIPLVAKRMAQSGAYSAVIALGCIIRGATPHFDYVAAEAAKGVGHAMLDTGVPILFGILTTENIEQAVERAGTKAGNKGSDAAMGALEMINLMEQI